MLDLVETGRLHMLFSIAEMLLSIFLPRSTVLRHHAGPQGGMLELQRAETVSQRIISAGVPREGCLSPVHTTQLPQLSWDKVSTKW